MKISLLSIARNADNCGVNYKVAQKTILEHVAVKMITQSLNILS